MRVDGSKTYVGDGWSCGSLAPSRITVGRRQAPSPRTSRTPSQTACDKQKKRVKTRIYLGRCSKHARTNVEVHITCEGQIPGDRGADEPCSAMDIEAKRILRYTLVIFRISFTRVLTV